MKETRNSCQRIKDVYAFLNQQMKAFEMAGELQQAIDGLLEALGVYFEAEVVGLYKYENNVYTLTNAWPNFECEIDTKKKDEIVLVDDMRTIKEERCTSMRIIAADDERLALDMLTESIQEADSSAEVISFLKAKEILPYVEEHGCDIAFLDIRMRSVSGVEIAMKIKAIQPKVNIIFVTGYGEYASDAMKMHASGYIEKPVTAQKIKKELEDLRYPIAKNTHCLLKAVCFGNFDVYEADGSPVHFERSKAKECLAYLISRCGSSCSIREIASILFENEPYDKNQANYMQKIISSMMRSLKAIGAQEIIQKHFNKLSVDIEKIDCDYYQFRAGDIQVQNQYQGMFMAQYSWAEQINGYLENQVKR